MQSLALEESVPRFFQYDVASLRTLSTRALDLASSGKVRPSDCVGSMEYCPMKPGGFDQLDDFASASGRLEGLALLGGNAGSGTLPRLFG